MNFMTILSPAVKERMLRKKYLRKPSDSSIDGVNDRCWDNK